MFELRSTWTQSFERKYSHPKVVPHGESLHFHPSLNFNVGLSLDGITSFYAPDFHLSVSPLHFGITGPRLMNDVGLHLLRGKDGEIEITFDEHSSRHVFFLGKAPSVPKFSLRFKVSTIVLLCVCSLNYCCSSVHQNSSKAKDTSPS